MQILHLPASPRIGEILSEAMEKQLCHELKTREEAVEWVKKLLK
jgi:hypothetical protein